MAVQRKHQHLFPIINEMVSRAEEDCGEDGEVITCKKGCDHCCHLLIEVSWEEAAELAEAIKSKPPEDQQMLIDRTKANAAEARRFFLSSPATESFAIPVRGEFELPDEAYDGYFYDKKRSCPFLTDGACEAYESRPTPCRLHLVASDPDLCSKDIQDHDDYNIPDRIERLKEEAAPVIEALERDGRWGQMGIVLEAVLDEMRLTTGDADAEGKLPASGGSGTNALVA